MLRTSSQRSRYKCPSKLEFQYLALEMDELLKTQELILETANYFNVEGIYYRVYFHNVKSSIDNNPLYEYRITRSNINTPFINKKGIKKLIIENNYEPIWTDDFYYYLPGTNINYKTREDCQIDFIFKRTYYLEYDDCSTILK